MGAYRARYDIAPFSTDVRDVGPKACTDAFERAKASQRGGGSGWSPDDSANLASVAKSFATFNRLVAVGLRGANARFQVSVGFAIPANSLLTICSSVLRFPWLMARSPTPARAMRRRSSCFLAARSPCGLFCVFLRCDVVDDSQGFDGPLTGWSEY